MKVQSILIGVCVFILVLIFINSCINTNKNNNFNQVVIPTLNCSLMLPNSYVVQVINDNSVMICLKESLTTRYPQCFSIQKMKKQVSIEKKAYLILQNQSYFYYDINSFEGGSGGKEEYLTGYVTIKEIVFKVESNVQGDQEKLNSKWFFPILETFEVE